MAKTKTYKGWNMTAPGMYTKAWSEGPRYVACHVEQGKASGMWWWARWVGGIVAAAGMEGTRDDAIDHAEGVA